MNSFYQPISRIALIILFGLASNLATADVPLHIITICNYSIPKTNEVSSGDYEVFAGSKSLFKADELKINTCKKVNVTPPEKTEILYIQQTISSSLTSTTRSRRLSLGPLNPAYYRDSIIIIKGNNFESFDFSTHGDLEWNLTAYLESPI